MKKSKTAFRASRRAFSLIEVVLAIGIFLVTVLALVGLLGPTLQSVDEVEKTDEVSSVVNTVNAFLQNSPDIATDGVSKFATIYNAVGSGDHATVFVFRSFRTGSTESELKIGFVGEIVGTGALLTGADFANVAGPIYRVVLTASSVTPDQYLEDATARDGNGIYTLGESIDNYMEGYFAMEARIFALEADMSAAVGTSGSLPQPGLTLADLVDVEPIFTYNPAIVR